MAFKMKGPTFFGKSPLKNKPGSLMDKGSKITAEGKGTTGEGTWDKHGFGPHKKSILSKPPLKQTTDTKKKKKEKTWPKNYTKKDIEFLKSQNEDIVRRSDFDEGSEQQKLFDANQAKIKAEKEKNKKK